MSGVAAKDEVWVGYRFVALAGTKAAKGLKIIDFGAGHASASETLCGRIIGALMAEVLLNELKHSLIRRCVVSVRALHVDQGLTDIGVQFQGRS